MDTRAVLLTDSATRRAVAATLQLSMTAGEILAVEAIWGPLRAGLQAQHSHWDWNSKAGYLVDPAVRCMGVECGGQMQGMVLIREGSHRARLAPDQGELLVYVDYVESAPWNYMAATRRYGNVGPVLLQESILRSIALGYGGRIGLHALPQVESFYSQRCGLIGFGRDPAYHGLAYFEFTAAQGTAFAEA